MRISIHLKQKLILPLVLGLCDGIITILTFIANRLINSSEFITLSFAIRISSAALITGIFVYFISQYAELRRQLLHTERELNLTTRGRLAMTNLGKQIFFESVLSAAIASIAAFFGAFIPVIVAITFQKYKWTSVLSAVMSLGILGVFLAKLVYRNKARWIFGLIISGLIVSYIGMKLNVV